MQLKNKKIQLCRSCRPHHAAGTLHATTCSFKVLAPSPPHTDTCATNQVPTVSYLHVAVAQAAGAPPGDSNIRKRCCMFHSEHACSKKKPCRYDDKLSMDVRHSNMQLAGAVTSSAGWLGFGSKINGTHTLQHACCNFYMLRILCMLQFFYMFQVFPMLQVNGCNIHV